MSQPIVTDQASTTALIMAFEDAVTAHQFATQQILSAQEELRGTWKGNAAHVFHEGLNDFQDGLTQVKMGLDELANGMTQYSQLTTTTEDDSVNVAHQALGNPNWSNPFGRN